MFKNLEKIKNKFNINCHIKKMSSDYTMPNTLGMHDKNILSFVVFTTDYTELSNWLSHWFFWEFFLSYSRITYTNFDATQLDSILFFDLYNLILIPIFAVCLLISVAFYTLLERKVMSSMQRRIGPNVVGFWGILQPFADGLKLVLKEIILPRRANNLLFLFAPFFTFALSLTGWTIIPFNISNVLANVHLGLLFLFAISSLGVYGVILAGWASNSRYAFLGALRSAAQMISYEVSIGFIFIILVLCTGTFNLIEIVSIQKNVWLCFPLFPLVIIFFISMLAETNRAPFDLPEAEAELVAGYNVEYASIIFAMFFLAEYLNMLLMSSLMVIFFFGGWNFLFFKDIPFIGEFIFSIKITFFAYAFVWVRATFPRYRYDQLMSIGWKIFLPLTLGFLLFFCGILLAFNAFKVNTALDWGFIKEFLNETVQTRVIPACNHASLPR